MEEQIEHIPKYKSPFPKRSEKLSDLELADGKIHFSSAAKSKGLKPINENLLIAIDKFALESYPYSDSSIDRDEFLKQIETLKHFIDEKGAYWDDMSRLDHEFLIRRLNGKNFTF